MVDLMHCRINLLFFAIPFYLYIILILIHPYLLPFFWAIYLSLSFSISLLTSSTFFCEDFETLVILSAILLPIKSPGAFAVFE